MYDLIYANGDSFTAGRDLVDHWYLGHNYPLQTFTSWIDTIKKVEKSTIKYLESKNSTLHEYISPAEIKVAFPAQLGKLTNTKVISNAISGNGITNICLNSYKDLIHLSKKHKKILALIGLTNAGRLWFPNPKNPSNTLILNRTGGYKTKEEKLISEWYVLNANWTDLHLIMANQLIGLVKLAEELNIDLYFIGNPLLNDKHFNEAGDEYNSMTNIIRNKMVDVLGGRDICDHFDKPRFSSTGHLPIQDHLELAERLKEKFWT